MLDLPDIRETDLQVRCGGGFGAYKEQSMGGQLHGEDLMRRDFGVSVRKQISDHVGRGTGDSCGPAVESDAVLCVYPFLAGLEGGVGEGCWRGIARGGGYGERAEEGRGECHGA